MTRYYRNKYANFDVEPALDQKVWTNKGVLTYVYGEFYGYFRVYGIQWWEALSYNKPQNPTERGG